MSELIGVNGKSTKKENDSPLMESEDIKAIPMGSKMIVRGFWEPEGLVKNVKPKLSPVFEVMKIGSKVAENKHIKEGDWVLSNGMFEPGVFKYKDEKFFIMQEHEVSMVYEEQPAYEDVIETSTHIARDLTNYVKYDKMAALRANIETIDPNEDE